METLLCLSIIVGEHRVDLIGEEIRCMYCLKKNGIDKDKAYISALVGHGLHLKLPNSASSWKDIFLHHKSELINKLDSDGKEKIRWIEL